MSLPLSCDSFDELCCDECHFQKFTSKYEFKLHCTAHKREPVVTLVKLSEYSLEKLQHHSYKINSGVARKSNSYVSPLKISLRKEEGSTTFQVIKKQKDKTTGNKSQRWSSEGKSKRHSKILQQKNQGSDDVEGEKVKDVEGNNNRLERFGANISVNRKGILSPAPHVKEEAETELCDSNLSKDVPDKVNSGKNVENFAGREVPADKQRCSANGGEPGNDETKLPTIANVLSKGNPEDPSARSKNDPANDKQGYSKSILIRRLSGVGFSLIPKGSKKDDSVALPELNDSAEKENKVQEIHSNKDSDAGVFLQVNNNNNNGDDVKESRNDNNTVLPCGKGPGGKVMDERLNGSRLSVKTPVSVQKNGRTNLSDCGGTKKRVRVKNSKVNKKNVGSDGKIGGGKFILTEGAKCNYIHGKQNSLVPDTCGDRIEDFILQNTIHSQREKGKKKTMKTRINSTTKKQFQSEFVGNRNSHVQEPGDCSVLLSPGSENQNGDRFGNVECDEGFHSEPYGEGNNSTEENNDEVAVAYSSLPDKSPSLEEPQEDPLMTNESGADANGESLNQNFLHNFLNEPQTPQGNVQSEGPEFMSLERLGQVSGLEGQRGQSNFDLSGDDPTTPMEQLSQQVQRLPNPPQMNVIPQHHIPAPQPPQLHSGLPQLPTPQSGSFDALGHIQPPLPPPLYQGYNMYNQNFSAQGPQQLPPRPPLLQQRPQLPGRPFQSLAPDPRPRNRSSNMKRNSVRVSVPQEVPHKQRRLDTAAPARSQAATLSPTAISKIPSGITLTPSKKSLEASKVADVLASRGITVTPSHVTLRQSSPSAKSQHKSNPILNLGPGVSITPNNGSRTSGNFAVPSPRRSGTIVNSSVERPERCATVDLTQDDDFPPISHNKTSPGRFPCNQCRKTFATLSAVEEHKMSHRSNGPLPFKCDKCSAQYPNASGLRQHKAVFHKAKLSAPELAIPIVDLGHPGARDELAKCGVRGFLPLSQLQTNGLGYFGLPIVHIDSTKEKTLSSLSSIGASNVLLLGKMKYLNQPQNR